MTASIENVANKFFDYILIGGGTAGLTLAARLTEDPDTSVLVLEAGEANLNDPALLRPASFGSHFGNKSYTWDHKTTKQKNLGGGSKGWDRGRGLGGSSGINFLCWTKPPAEEIDDFERLGNPGWNWDRYEKYVERTEGFVPPPEEVQKKNLLKFDTWKVGKQGPLKIAYPGKIEESELKVQQTLLNTGLPAAKNPISGDPNGVFFAPNTYDPVTHTRSYATTAFYLPSKDRSNFSVLTSAHVNHILTKKGENGDISAVGVEFEYDGKHQAVNAKKEVILCAGALKSPQILELSGIGRKEILEKIEIPLQVELSGVGENVQEHVFVASSFEIRDDVPFDTLDLLGDPEVAAKHIELHALGEGLFTMGIIGFAFTSLRNLSPAAESIFKATKESILKKMDSLPAGLQEQYKIQLERLDKNAPACEIITIPGLLSGPNPPEKGKRYISILAAANHFFSRGKIHSTSNDPSKDPEFDPHYFEEEIDLQTLLEMVKYVRNLANVAPFKDMIVKELNPGPGIQSDAEIIQWIKNQFSTTWHTAGSCSMLPKDKGGVVDPSLKVYGTNNIRVVDLSVVPLLFASHPQATVYSIAEQAADIIKGKI